MAVFGVFPERILLKKRQEKPLKKQRACRAIRALFEVMFTQTVTQQCVNVAGDDEGLCEDGGTVQQLLRKSESQVQFTACFSRMFFPQCGMPSTAEEYLECTCSEYL